MNKVIETKSQMIMRIAELSEENEQLKADIESRTMCITCERELQNCNLQAENERLKTENEKLAIRVANLNERFINGFNYNECRYKQALEDIRPLAEEIADTENWLNCGYNASRAKDILTKINEVIK